MNGDISEVIKNHISIIDAALGNLGIANLLDNGDFYPDTSSSGFHHLKVSYAASSIGKMPLIFTLEGDGIRLDLNGIEEAFEWTNDELIGNRASSIRLIEELLSSYILFESFGSAFTCSRIILFNKNGTFVAEYQLRGRKPRFFQKSTNYVLFFPIY